MLVPHSATTKHVTQASTRSAGSPRPIRQRHTYRASGALVMAGTYSNPHDEVILRELSDDGTILSNRKFGGPGDQTLLDATVAESGDVVAAGVYEQTVDFGGGPLPSATKANLFVARFNAEGEHVFSAGIPTSGTLHGAEVGVDGAGRVVVAGTFDGTLEVGGATLTSAGKRDAFVISLDASGTPLWSKAFGDGEEQWVHDVAVDAQGRIALVGALVGTLDFGGGPLTTGGGTSVLVGLLDAGGNHLWSRSFGGVGGHQKGFAIALTAAGEIVVTGEASSGPIDFGGGALSHVRPSVFVAKLAP